MGDAEGDTSAFALEQDAQGDRYAVLCAVKPGHYLTCRALAGVAAVALVTFAFDAIAFLSWAIAQSPALAFLLIGSIGDDVTTIAESRLVVPHAWWRLVLLLVSVTLLGLVVRWSERDLWSSHQYMEATVRGRSAWPSRWAPVVDALVSVGVCCALLAGIGGPLLYFLTSDDSWSYFPLALCCGLAAALVVTLTAGRGGFWLMQLVPSAHLARTDVLAAEAAENLRRREEAERLWPPLPEVRLPAAVRVMASPPAPSGRRPRVRDAWWVRRATSVEDLATELVVQALLDADSLGILRLAAEPSRSVTYEPALAEDRQPAGLAALVAGVHRVGLVAGRSPVSLSYALADIAGVDPFAAVIDVALSDLESLGSARRHPSTGAWQLSAERLEENADAQTAPPGDGQTRDLRAAALRPRTRRLIKSCTTTRADSGTGARMLAFFFVESGERSERRGYTLPGPW